MSEQLSLLGIEAPPAMTDRLFFALMPDGQTAEDIAHLAARVKAAHGLAGTPLQTSRFHVTLLHLGDFPGLPEAVVESAKRAAGSLSAAPMEIVFDQAGSFTRKGAAAPCVLKASQAMDGLVSFQRRLAAALEAHGALKRAGERFTPHLTLLYDRQVVPDHPVPPVRWTAHEFVLMRSLLGKTQHIPLGRWPLR